MKYPFFSYDPEDGFDIHKTKEEAIAACNLAIDGYRDIAGDGWDECVELICWGEIKQRATVCDIHHVKVNEDDPETECTECCDYRLA